jgi:hypothetical protein
LKKQSTDLLELPAGWLSPSPESARQFEQELQRELCPQHVLYNVPAQAVGRKDRRDDFLFKIPDNCFAQVHLTWRQETDPFWPATDLFSSFEAWKTSLDDEDFD